MPTPGEWVLFRRKTFSLCPPEQGYGSSLRADLQALQSTTRALERGRAVRDEDAAAVQRQLQDAKAPGIPHAREPGNVGSIIHFVL